MNMSFLARLLLNGVAIVVASYFIPGLVLDGVAPAVMAGIILGFINAVVRPILFFLTLPFTLLTLGLFVFVLNAICVALTAAVVPGFEIEGFRAAFVGALVITVISWVLNSLIARD